MTGVAPNRKHKYDQAIGYHMPPVWGWILAYLLGFLLFQAVIYWYLQGDGPSVEEPTPGYRGDEMPAHPAVERPETMDSSEDGSIRCPHCGTYNDLEASYTYCRDCVGQLR